MRLRHAHATVSVRLGDLGQVAGRARLFAGRGGRGAIGEQSGRLSRRRKRSEADARGAVRRFVASCTRSAIGRRFGPQLTMGWTTSQTRRGRATNLVIGAAL